MRVPHPRLVSPILTALLLAGAVLPLAVAPAAATGGDSMVPIVNRYRSEAGLGPVALHGTIDALAQERSDEVAAAQVIGHDFEALKVRFAQLGICWSAFGEIVLRGGS
ncbi:MAG: CAP domain-containing protein, partial [Candidatus Limnocylindria bacterium]